MEIEKKIREENIPLPRPALSLEDERNLPFSLAKVKPVEPENTRSLHKKPAVPISDNDVRSRLHWEHTNSAHFDLLYDSQSFKSKEANILLYQLETAYHNIFYLTHEGFGDRFMVYAFDARTPALLGRSVRSHFNAGDRTIYLARTNSEAIEAELIMAMAHAMRFPRYLKHYGITRGWAMLEDAFAVFLSERLRSDKPVFPFYGADPEVIVASLKEKSQVRLLTHIWPSRNFANGLERFVIGGAFLLFLGDVAGDDKIVGLSRHDEEVSGRTFQLYFGKSLETLEEHWQEHLPKYRLSYTHEECDEMITNWAEHISGRL
jgi:hypothetical protein